MKYISPTWRPCCKTLWEEDHAPACETLAEEKIVEDHEEWGRDMVLMEARHVEGNPS
tara:strand:- start:2380 stop:2550 length:171 start_codon:yes stop_codon:yes gene_type:complete